MEAINLTLVDWSHIQELDDEQLLLKCRHCREYENFARNCKKKEEDTTKTRKEGHWKIIQKKTGGKIKSITKEKEGQQEALESGTQSNPSPKNGLETIRRRFESHHPLGK